MKESKDPAPLDHEGIRETKGTRSRWWKWLLFLAIAVAALDGFYDHKVHLRGLQREEARHELERREKLKGDAIADFEPRLETLVPLADPADLARGQETFKALCAPCHRDDAGGWVGPNLTDDYWIHGSNFMDSLKVIWDGVPEKGMVNWRGILQTRDVLAVASYIYSLRGTHPPNPKPPENQVPQDTAPNPFE